MFILLVLFGARAFSQGCCSGGSGSPIAGGASQGVLKERQFEIAPNYQYMASSRFKSGERDTAKLFDILYSNYLYLRLAYGITDKFTLSLESGYFLNKTEIRLDRSDTVRSGGIGDLILFPRYCVYTHNTERTRTEITLGLGYKIPLGKYNDSTLVFTDPSTGKQYFTTSPPTVQATTGSHDLIFYGFVYRGWPDSKFRIFSNMLYIRKGWNALGEKFGDYATLGLFAGWTFLKKAAITLQLRGEWVDSMKQAKNVDLLALYNVDIRSTGSRKLFCAPQLSYTHKNVTVYVMSEFPLYQHVNGVQVVSQKQYTAGLSYRFFVKTHESASTAPAGSTE
jgi:hypothetical protein